MCDVLGADADAEVIVVAELVPSRAEKDKEELLSGTGWVPWTKSVYV